MKTFWLILTAGPVLALNAQTNPPPPKTPQESPPPAPTLETSLPVSTLAPALTTTSAPAPATVLTTTNGTGSIAATNAPGANVSGTNVSGTNVSGTNVSGTNASSTNALAAGPPVTEIFSDMADFNLKTRIAIYLGHVRVADPRMKLTCEQLTAKVPESGGRIDSIVAEGSVVIDAVDEHGNPVHATSDKAVYTYNVVNSVTNETIRLTGNPRVARDHGFITGDPIIWDRQSNKFQAVNQHMVIQGGTGFAPEPKPEPQTNAPPPAAPPEVP